MSNKANVPELFASRRVAAVCFDVDSTVSPHEGIDEFAAFLGMGEDVAKVTKQAMEGSLDFRQALQRRLEVMKVTPTKIEAFLRAKPPVLTPGVKDLIHKLEARGIKVFLVSGGFRSFIEPLAEELGLNPAERLFANRFVFPETKASEDSGVNETGSEVFASFDTNEPTSASGGKARAVATIIEKFLKPDEGKSDGGNSPCVIMVGDGATDLEAKPPAAAVIGFGGVVARQKVRDEADMFVTSFDEIAALL